MPDDPPFRVNQIDTHTLQLVGELDMATVATFNAATESAPRNGQMTLDLSELTFIDSNGLHALMKYARSRDGQGPLLLINLPSFAVRVFEVVGFDQDSAIELE